MKRGPSRCYRRGSRKGWRHRAFPRDEYVLSFRVGRRWFDLIKSGAKRIEVRKQTAYWRKRADRLTEAQRFRRPVPTSAVFVCGKDTHRRAITAVSWHTSVDALREFGYEVDLRELFGAEPVIAFHLGEEVQ